MTTDVTTQSIKEKLKLRVLPLVFIGVGFAILGTSAAVFVSQSNSAIGKISCVEEIYGPFGQLPSESDQQSANHLLASNELVRKAYGNYQRWPSESRQSRLQESLQQRKKALLQAMVLNHELAKKVAGSLGSSGQLTKTNNCIEQPVTLEGALEVTHADFFEEKQSQTKHVLKTNQGDKLLRFEGSNDARFVSQAVVKVQGFEIDDQILSSVSNSADGETALSTTVITEAPSAQTTGEIRALVVSVKFTDSTPETINPLLTPEWLHSRLTERTGTTEATGSVNSFFQEASYGHSTLNTTVLSSNDPDGWFTVNLPRASACGKSDEVISVIDDQVNFQEYRRLIILYDVAGVCASGLATVGEDLTRTGDGDVSLGVSMLRDNTNDTYIVDNAAHELGHNFGLYHADMLKCPNATFNIDDPGCVLYEASDFYDEMGYGQVVEHFSAPHKEILGWLNSTNIQSVQTSGTFTIAAYETDTTPSTSGTTDVKALRINRTRDTYWYAEYRQPIGFDAELPLTSIYPNDVFSGVIIHLLVTTAGARSTNLLDATVSPVDPPNEYIITLPFGQSVTDPMTNTTMTVTSLTPTSATVSVAVGYDFVKPTAAITAPPENGTISGSVPITVSASDNIGVQQVRFSWSGGGLGPAFFATETAPSSGTPQNGTYTANLDTTQVPNGTVTVTGQAFDAKNNYSTAVSKKYNVANPDSQSPSASIISPASGSVVLGTFPSVGVIAAATDNVGIWKVEFFVNGNAIPHTTSYASPFTLYNPWDGPPKFGPYSIRAKAYDFVGNTTLSTPVDFILRNTNDQIAPTVNITSPSAGASIGGPTNITVAADDSSGIQSFDVIVDNVKIATLPTNSTTESYRWDASSVAIGNHSLSAGAWDNSGNYAVSPAVIVDVVSSGGSGNCEDRNRNGRIDVGECEPLETQ